MWRRIYKHSHPSPPKLALLPGPKFGHIFPVYWSYCTAVWWVNALHVTRHTQIFQTSCVYRCLPLPSFTTNRTNSRPEKVDREFERSNQRHTFYYPWVQVPYQRPSWNLFKPFISDSNIMAVARSIIGVEGGGAIFINSHIQLLITDFFWKWKKFFCFYGMWTRIYYYRKLSI